MSSKLFLWLIVAVVAVGGMAGGIAYALSGSEDPTPSDLEAASSDDANSVIQQFGPDGQQTITQGEQPSGFVPPEFISGTLTEATASSLTMQTDAGAVTTDIPPETPVRRSTTVGEGSEALAQGTDIIAFLVREQDGGFSATNITVGGGGRGFPGGERAGRIGAFSFGTGDNADGTEFNAVPGSMLSLSDGVLTLSTESGETHVSITDETPLQLNDSYATVFPDLPVGEEITILSQRNDDGTLTPITITVGQLAVPGGFGGRRFGGGGDGGRGFQDAGGGGAFFFNRETGEAIPIP